jgi:hypothetical protein
MIKDSDEWFYDSIPLSEDPPNSSKYQSGLPKNPLDSMPIANGSNRYASPERKAELEAEVNPRPEEDMADWFKVEKPDESDEIEEEKTIHQKMYEIATSRYNPFSIGGSENCDSDISCNIGGSEQIQ